MSTDVLPKMRIQRQPRRPQPRGQRRCGGPGRWWRRGLIALGVVAAAGSALALIPAAISSPTIGSKLTYTVTRGDLVVTTTETGILESSDNTEIKCKVRGQRTVIWVIESGTEVKPGDELVRLDTLTIENAISERTKYAHWSRSSAERSRATVARAELAIPEYLEGRYRTQLMTLEKDLAVAESNLRSARNMLAHAEMMAERGYVSALDVAERRLAITRAELNREVKKTAIDVLNEFTKKMELETLTGNLSAARARLAADEERAKMDAARRDLAVQELEYCVVRAPRSGLVIYPSAARWKNAPEVSDGATVHKDQVLLLMPDLAKMQVKVGIRESVIDRIKPGLAARVIVPGRTLAGQVSSVAPVTAPAGWWTGNVVRYDTIIKLPSVEGLRPGMSAEVEVFVARHEDVLTIPVAAVVETGAGNFCWIKTARGARRRTIELGDTNDVFTVVKAGLEEGDEVVLNPLAFEPAPTGIREPLDEARRPGPGSQGRAGDLPRDSHSAKNG